MLPFGNDNGVPILMPMFGVCKSRVVPIAFAGTESDTPKPELTVTPGVGVNNPGGWFANAANAADVGSMNADGVSEGVNRNGSAGALGVGSRSSWVENLI